MVPWPTTRDKDQLRSSPRIREGATTRRASLTAVHPIEQTMRSERWVAIDPLDSSTTTVDAFRRISDALFGQPEREKSRNFAPNGHGQVLLAVEQVSHWRAERSTR